MGGGGRGKHCNVAEEKCVQKWECGKVDLQIQGFLEVPLIYLSKSIIRSGYLKGAPEYIVTSHRQKTTSQLCPVLMTEGISETELYPALKAERTFEIILTG